MYSTPACFIREPRINLDENSVMYIRVCEEKGKERESLRNAANLDNPPLTSESTPLALSFKTSCLHLSLMFGQKI